MLIPGDVCINVERLITQIILTMKTRLIAMGSQPNFILLNHTGPYGTNRGHMRPYGTIQDHIGPNRTIRDHTGPYGTI